MPMHIPAALAKAKVSELVSYGVAGIAGFAPIALIFAPTAGEHMARQTTHWAPRWELATGYLTPHAQRVVRHHVTPPVERTMQHVDRVAGPHMERTAQSMHLRIRNGFNWWLQK